LRPCIAPIARWVSGLLHLLFDIATHGLLALGIAMADWIVLVALVSVVPPVFEASSRRMTNLRSVNMALRS
jgi:Zn-dependent membrane protease YugP